MLIYINILVSKIPDTDTLVLADHFNWNWHYKKYAFVPVQYESHV